MINGEHTRSVEEAVICEKFSIPGPLGAAHTRSVKRV